MMHMSRDSSQQQLTLIHFLCSPKDTEGNAEYDSTKVEDFYREIFSDLSVDRDESEDLFTFFQDNIPSAMDLVPLRAAVFKTASEYLTDDTENNTALLRCVNFVINAFERTCLL